MFQWLEIEGIRYEWDGQQLRCQGADGPLSYSELSNLELEDDDGSVLGYLSVDPAQERISFVATVPPEAEALAGQHIRVGSLEGEESIALTDLSSDVRSPAEEMAVGARSDETLNLAAVLDDVETLDVFFGAQHQTLVSPVSHQVSETAWSMTTESLPLFGDELQYL